MKNVILAVMMMVMMVMSISANWSVGTDNMSIPILMTTDAMWETGIIVRHDPSNTDARFVFYIEGRASNGLAKNVTITAYMDGNKEGSRTTWTATLRNAGQGALQYEVLARDNKTIVPIFSNSPKLILAFPLADGSIVEKTLYNSNFKAELASYNRQYPQ